MILISTKEIKRCFEIIIGSRELSIQERKNIIVRQNEMLDQTGDRCYISDIWHEMYNIIIGEIQNDTIRNAESNIPFLKEVANSCPERYGHVVFTARSMMQKIDGRTYKSEKNCGLTDRRSDSSSRIL